METWRERGSVGPLFKDLVAYGAAFPKSISHLIAYVPGLFLSSTIRQAHRKLLGGNRIDKAAPSRWPQITKDVKRQSHRSHCEDYGLPSVSEVPKNGTNISRHERCYRTADSGSGRVHRASGDRCRSCTF